MAGDEEWLSTEDVAASVGMTAEWVRLQIVERRLPAVAWETGRRRTYRIRSADLEEFRRRYARRTDDPEWQE